MTLLLESRMTQRSMTLLDFNQMGTGTCWKDTERQRHGKTWTTEKDKVF